MLVWLLVLFLLIVCIFVIYKLSFTAEKKEFKEDTEHFTFKI